jgi:hypothetical protein
MRTLQEKYNGIQEGKFSKEHFLAEARMQQPQLITRFNGYDDAVQILKNKGMIVEARVEEVTPAQEKYRVKPSAKPTQFKQDIAAAKKMIDAGKSEKEVVAKYGQAAFNAVNAQNLGEARLTKNNLTDYRYKPTNEMDKYPYEQILRGIRVELEVAGVFGTPTADEYAKALAKVSKNLAKDSIFYTNQLAGVNPKVDLHDKMVDATAKNTVDTFNGMKKAALKEDHSKNPDDKYMVKTCGMEGTPWAVWEGKKRVKGFATKAEAKEYADKQNKKQGLSENILKEGIKNLIKKVLSENTEEGVYEMHGSKEDSYYKSELADYLDDNGIFGFTSKIHSIMTGPDESENADELVRFLEDNQIYGYGRGIEAIYADYPYDQHYMNQPDEDEDDIPHPIGYEEASDEEDQEGDPGYKGYESPSDRAMNSDAWVQAQRDMMEGNKSEKELRAEWEKHQATSHPEDKMSYMEWRSEQGLDEAIDTEADKNMVRKLMLMYETDPAKFAKLHKQAQTQASTTRDIKFKHLLSLFNRAKAGASQKATPEIPGFKGTRDALDDLFESDKFYAPTYITQKYGAAKAKEIEANIEDEGANTWDLFTSLETPKEVDDFIGGFTMDESVSLKDIL